MRKTGEQNRTHVLDTATRLFYSEGIRAVGMDQIVREAGVGNATVYRQFRTKDELAAAFVQQCADNWFDRMRAAADRVADPREKLVAIFTVTAEDIAGAGYRGCPMLNTHTEFPGADHPAHAVAVAHKGDVRDWLRDLARLAGAHDPETLADDLLIVLNGALVTASVLGACGPAAHATPLARQLVTAACS
ncbi:MAG TPA: helix-turn-helix domain-containing protein [Jatrophihabitans sp.]|jgi:AcrR family transcriptional regulator